MLGTKAVQNAKVRDFHQHFLVVEHFVPKDTSIHVHWLLYQGYLCGHFEGTFDYGLQTVFPITQTL